MGFSGTDAGGFHWEGFNSGAPSQRNRAPRQKKPRRAIGTPFTRVLINLGVRRGMVVYGQEKLDEISVTAPTSVCEIRDGWFKSYVITPEEFGIRRCSRADLQGGTPEENAKITLAILNGRMGPKRDAVLMNAGASLYIGGKAESLREGIVLAGELIDSGKALAVLQKLIETSNRKEEQA